MGAVAGAASATRVQSYSRRPLAPWPALPVIHWAAGTPAASSSALVRTTPLELETSSSSVH
jgi:hypothetical protein